MATSREACRKIKAVLCIAMLAGAEAHYIQQEGRSTSSSSGAGTSTPMHDLDFKTMMANLNIQEQAKRIGTFLGDSNSESLKQATRLAEHMQAMLEDANFQTSAKHIAKKLEEMKDDPNFEQQTKVIAKQIEAMMTSPTLQDQVQGIAKQHPAFHEQAKTIAVQMEKLMTHPSVQQHAKRVVEQMEAPARRLSATHRRLLQRAHQSEPVETSGKDAVGNRSIDVQNSMHFFDRLSRKFADNLLDRVLQASQVHSADLDQATVGKPGHLAMNSRAVLTPLAPLRAQSGATHAHPSVAFAKPGQISLRTNLAHRLRHRLYAAENTEGEQSTAVSQKEDRGLAGLLDPYTRAGVLIWSTVLALILPWGAFQIAVSAGFDKTKVGEFIGGFFVLALNLAWASTYLFRVNNKEMTYATQLRQYEEQVMKKRLEELPEDELEALMEDGDAEKKKMQEKIREGQKR